MRNVLINDELKRKKNIKKCNDGHRHFETLYFDFKHSLLFKKVRIHARSCMRNDTGKKKIMTLLNKNQWENRYLHWRSI